MQQEELPMKDVTPKVKPRKANPASKTEMKVSKSAEVGIPTSTALTTSAAPSEPKNMLQIIENAVATPGFDVASMRALLDMQKEMIAEERRQSFDAAFIALQAELPVINKDGGIVIPGRKTTPYATFEGIMESIQPLLTKYKFGLSFETKSSETGLLVIGHLNGHGHERRTEFPLPAEVSGSKNPVQSWGSTLAYGKRYCTIALLNIRTKAVEDADTNGFPGDFKRGKGNTLVEAPREPESLTAQEAKDLRSLIDDCGIDVAKFCQHYQLEKVADLPRNLLSAARKRCNDSKASRGARR